MKGNQYSLSSRHIENSGPAHKAWCICGIPIVCLFMTILLTMAPGTEIQAQEENGDIEFVQPISSGNTTGLVAEMIIDNNTSSPKLLLAATYYIPAIDRYQSYVVKVNEQIIVPANGNAVVRFFGYCVDVNRPAVPLGDNMLPLEDWIQVGDATKPDPSGLEITASDIIKLPAAQKVEPYTSEDAESITGSSIYNAYKTEGDADLKLLFPYSGRALNGSLERDRSPTQVAALTVAYVEVIENATPIVQQSNLFITPFNSDAVKEAESITQQTIWIAMGLLDGNPYSIKQFADRVYSQYASARKDAEELSNEQKDLLEPGIESFWEVFAATGLQAGVFSYSDNEMGSRLKTRIQDRVQKI